MDAHNSPIAAQMSADFETLLQAIKSSYCDDEMREQLDIGLRRNFASPPSQEISLRLPWKTRAPSDDDTRKLLYFPASCDMRDFVILISSTGGEGSSSTEQTRTVQRQALLILYLAHVKNWELMRSFIANNGLEELVKLFVAEDLYMRGQAVDCFLQLTDCTFFNWCAPAPFPDPEIHVKLFELYRTDIVRNLVANRDRTFPGGSELALQVLAFWLSWMRQYYTPSFRLPLSKPLLEALRQWSEKADSFPSERDLAQTVYADFSCQATLDPSSFTGDGLCLHEGLLTLSVAEHGSCPGSPSQVLAVSDMDLPPLGGDSDNLSTIDTSSDVGSDASSTSMGKQHKLRGMRAMKKGNWQAAVDHFTIAIDLEFGNCVYHDNRALSYLKVAHKYRAAAAAGDEEAIRQRKEALEAALDDAESACSMDFSYMEGFYRKAQALAELGRYPEALKIAAKAQRLGPDIEETYELHDWIAARIEEEKRGENPNTATCTPTIASNLPSSAEEDYVHASAAATAITVPGSEPPPLSPTKKIDSGVYALPLPDAALSSLDDTPDVKTASPVAIPQESAARSPSPTPVPSTLAPSTTTAAAGVALDDVRLDMLPDGLQDTHHPLHECAMRFNKLAALAGEGCGVEGVGTAADLQNTLRAANLGAASALYVRAQCLLRLRAHADAAEAAKTAENLLAGTVEGIAQEGIAEQALLSELQGECLALATVALERQAEVAGVASGIQPPRKLKKTTLAAAGRVAYGTPPSAKEEQHTSTARKVRFEDEGETPVDPAAEPASSGGAALFGTAGASAAPASDTPSPATSGSSDEFSNYEILD